MLFESCFESNEFCILFIDNCPIWKFVMSCTIKVLNTINNKDVFNIIDCAICNSTKVRQTIIIYNAERFWSFCNFPGYSHEIACCVLSPKNTINVITVFALLI